MLDPSRLPANEEIVKAYLHAIRDREDSESEPWPVTAFRLLNSREPARAWDVLCLLVEGASGDVLADIGAGEMESFVTLHAPEYIYLIEERARLDPRFRAALGDVWITRGAFPPDLEERLQHASGGLLTILDEDE